LVVNSHHIFIFGFGLLDFERHYAPCVTPCSPMSLATTEAHLY
jgi:hypothetical protein